MKVKPCPKCLGTGTEVDQQALGARMWKARADACKSLCEVARFMGIDTSYLSYLEAGKRNWSPDLVEKFNAALARE